MITVSLETHASIDDVLAVLHEAPCYAKWVVGARDVISVDASWPAPGASFTHEVGVGPLHLQDRTTLLVDEGDHLVLEARALPVGRARVELHLTPTGDGTRIEFGEVPVSGPARFVPRLLLGPITRRRNTVSLERLRDLAEAGLGRSEPGR